MPLESIPQVLLQSQLPCYFSFFCDGLFIFSNVDGLQNLQTVDRRTWILTAGLIKFLLHKQPPQCLAHYFCVVGFNEDCLKCTSSLLPYYQWQRLHQNYPQGVRILPVQKEVFKGNHRTHFGFLIYFKDSSSFWKGIGFCKFKPILGEI